MRNYTYCDLEDFSKQYKDNIHGYLSLTVCIFGSLTNIFNICVLMTKQMRSPTNSILTGLAVADLLVMLQYVPFTIHRNLPPSPLHYSHFNYPWALFYKVNHLFTLVLHFIACMLTIILAVWRYVFVSQVHANRVCSDQLKTGIVILATYFVCPLICFPILSTSDIEEYQQTCDLHGFIVTKEFRNQYTQSELKNETIYMLRLNDSSYLNIWVYSLLLKFVPCVLLTVLSYKIISVLVETRRRRIKLLTANSPLEEVNAKRKTNKKHSQKENQAERTTKMLLAVLILFLVMEFPQAIMGQISALYGTTFLEECYAALGDVMDIMALINSSINFVLYCTMSRQFRATFQEIFKIKNIMVWIRRSSSKNASLEETRMETKMSLV